MINLLLRRFCQLIFVGWSVGTVTFVMMKFLPGDMAFRIAAARYGHDYVNLESAQRVAVDLGLNRPVWEQYVSWMWDLAHFNLGQSMVSGEQVTEKIMHHLGYSLWLGRGCTGVVTVDCFSYRCLLRTPCRAMA